MTVFRRLALVLAVVTLMAVFAPSQTRSASAATLTVSFFCESGGGSFFCDAFASGGTGSYTYSWTGAAGMGSFATGGCRGGTRYTVSVTVTDSSGASASRTRTLYCNYIMP